ncbi:EAL domain-containing protein [Natronospora cellulosivora (SeqCode)]
MLGFNNSIKNKIITFILLLSAVITLVLIILSANLSNTFLTDLLNYHGEAVVESYAITAGLWLEERQADVETYASLPLMTELNWGEVGEYLKREQEKNKDLYDVFFLADKQGNFFATDGSNGNIADRSYFNNAIQGQSLISGPLSSRATDNDIIVVVSPIEKNDEVIAVIGATIPLPVLNNYISGFTLDYDNAFSYIADKDGNIIVISNESDKYLTSIVQEKWSNRNRFNGILKSDIENETYLMYYHRLNRISDWYFVAQVSENFISSYIYQATSRLLIIALIGIMIAIILSYFISSNIAKPIIELKEVFDLATKGDLSVRAEVNRNDEIGKAALAFNKMMDTLNQVTYYDSSTGLPNRRNLDNTLSVLCNHAKNNNEKFAVITMNINQYQNIVDTMGYSDGDELLSLISKSLNDLSLSSDIQVFFSGHAEFVILLTENKEEELFKYIRKLFTITNRNWLVNNLKYNVNSTMGIAIYPENGEDETTLVKNSSLALHKAMKDKNDYQFFNQMMNDNLKEKLLLDNDLRKAIEEKQFILYYQAQYDLNANEFLGMEALIRWLHPEYGIISPAKFIPIAEENGLINEIGEMVLKEACSQHVRWRSLGFNPGKMAVNIATSQLMNDNFIDIVKNILNSTNMQASLLELEITERAVVESVSNAANTLDSLRNLGVKIAVDDFGTGYSSLQYLKDFAINNLKIDMSFIRELFEKENNKEIVRAIIAMAHSLNCKVTAEGVERKEQLEFLKVNNCDYAQGYYYAKPLAVDEIEPLLKKERAVI